MKTVQRIFNFTDTQVLYIFYTKFGNIWRITHVLTTNCYKVIDSKTVRFLVQSVHIEHKFIVDARFTYLLNVYQVTYWNVFKRWSTHKAQTSAKVKIMSLKMILLYFKTFTTQRWCFFACVAFLPASGEAKYVERDISSLYVNLFVRLSDCQGHHDSVAR